MENEITGKVIGCAIEAHRTLGGPGLFESIYEAALCHEMGLQGLIVERQKPVPILYKGVKIKDPLFLDILVEKQIIIEVKSTQEENLIFSAQLLTYLRMTGLKIGLLINFGKTSVKDGIQRIVNNLPE